MSSGRGAPDVRRMAMHPAGRTLGCTTQHVARMGVARCPTDTTRAGSGSTAGSGPQSAMLEAQAYNGDGEYNADYVQSVRCIIVDIESGLHKPYYAATLRLAP